MYCCLVRPENHTLQARVTFFRSAIRGRSVHQVMVTSPLGLVPRELEEQWPAAHYDVPVTGQWDDDELATIRRLVRVWLNESDTRR